MVRRNIGIKAILLVFLFAAVLIGGYLIGRHLEDVGYEQKRSTTSSDFGTLERVEYQGKTYIHKSQLTTILAIGYDHDESQERTGYRSGGQADFQMLFVIDHDKKTIRRLQIDRDTMTSITTVSVLGKKAGSKITHICLAHSYGGTEKESCEYTVEAVSNLLQGESIELYLSIGLNSISVLNDALGGVTVTLPQDYSSLDPTMTKGTTMTLHGKQAEYMVRSRMYIADGTNASRMTRQKVYMTAAVQKLREKVEENASFIGTLYDTLGDALTTNMSRGRMVNEANRAWKFTMGQIEYLEGSYAMGDDGFTQFHPDEDALVQWVIDAFYNEV